MNNKDKKSSETEEELFPSKQHRLLDDDVNESLPSGKARCNQGRDLVCSKYRMAWVMVFFDLPVSSSDERRDAANFRKELLKDGYVMVQFSIYARPCGSADRVETQVRRLKSKIPPHGEVRGLIVSDAQWGRMIVMRSQKKVESEKMPEQMMFF